MKYNNVSAVKIHEHKSPRTLVAEIPVFQLVIHKVHHQLFTRLISSHSNAKKQRSCMTKALEIKITLGDYPQGCGSRSVNQFYYLQKKSKRVDLEHNVLFSIYGTSTGLFRIISHEQSDPHHPNFIYRCISSEILSTLNEKMKKRLYLWPWPHEQQTNSVWLSSGVS